MGWLYDHRSKESPAIKEVQSKGNILFVLYAPDTKWLLHRLFLKLAAVQKSLAECTQFIVTCREPPNEKDFYFQKVAVEPLSFSDGSRLFEKFLRNMKKWGKFIAPPELKFHNGHGRERKIRKSSYCKGCVKRRRFSCRDNNHETCESCWANWELKYFYAQRRRPFSAQRDVPWGDSNLPDFGRSINQKCAKSRKEYLEIMDVVSDKRLGSPPPNHAFWNLPRKLREEIEFWLKRKECQFDNEWTYDLACCPSSSLEARSRKGNLQKSCLKCREIKYYIHCKDHNKDLCEDCWIRDNFLWCDIPIALANRLWSWEFPKKPLRRGSLHESAKYFSCFFLRGNPKLIWLAADLLHSKIGHLTCTINFLIELVYTFIDKDWIKLDLYLCGYRIDLGANKGCLPEKLPECSKETRDKIENFLKLLYKVHCRANVKQYSLPLRELKIQISYHL